MLTTTKITRVGSVGDASVGQPSTWTFIEFKAEESWAVELADETFVVFSDRVFRYKSGNPEGRAEPSSGDRPSGDGRLNKRGWGALRLTTIGRKSGQEHSVIVGYLEDGPNLISIAMYRWDEGHLSWWLNLEASPDAVVRLTDQHPRPVLARQAAEQERDRLWRREVTVDPRLDAYADPRSTEVPVIVLEPRRGTARHQARTRG